MNYLEKSYQKIMEEKDIKNALKFIFYRSKTIQMTNIVLMVIQELKNKGIIEEDFKNLLKKEREDNVD